MKKLNQQGIAHLTIIGLILIISIIGFVGWRVWDVRKDADQKFNDGKTSQTSPQNLIYNENGSSTVKGELIIYKNSNRGFKFSYPKVYGNLKVVDQEDSSILLFPSLSTGSPKVPIYEGIEGSIAVSTGDKNKATYTRKYGPSVKLTNGKWIIMETNEGDPVKEKVGDTYKDYKSQKNGNLTIYTFESGDEGAIWYNLTFIANGYMSNIGLPYFDTGNGLGDGPLKLNDPKPYNELYKQVINSIVTYP